MLIFIYVFIYFSLFIYVWRPSTLDYRVGPPQPWPKFLDLVDEQVHVFTFVLRWEIVSMRLFLGQIQLPPQKQPPTCWIWHLPRHKIITNRPDCQALGSTAGRGKRIFFCGTKMLISMVETWNVVWCLELAVESFQDNCQLLFGRLSALKLFHFEDAMYAPVIEDPKWLKGTWACLVQIQY